MNIERLLTEAGIEFEVVELGAACGFCEPALAA